MTYDDTTGAVKFSTLGITFPLDATNDVLKVTFVHGASDSSTGSPQPTTSSTGEQPTSSTAQPTPQSSSGLFVFVFVVVVVANWTLSQRASFALFALACFFKLSNLLNRLGWFEWRIAKQYRKPAANIQLGSARPR